MQRYFFSFLIVLSLFLGACSSSRVYEVERFLASEEDFHQRPNLSFYHYAETTFFSESDQRRFGVEIEFEGINSEETAKIVQENYGGWIEEVPREINIGIKEVLGEGKVIYETMEITDYKVRGTSLGDIGVITEFNETESIVDLNKVTALTELITAPIRADKLPGLQRLANILKAKGAKGTDVGRPVGIHVTAEINGGTVNDELSGFLTDLLRTILDSKNRRENAYSLNVAPERRPYLNYYTEGLAKRLRDPSYHPNMDQLYDDFIYRQTLELMDLGESSKAWRLPIKKVKEIVLSQDKQLIAEVVKFQPIKLTSLLIMLRPDDPMSELFYEIEGWIKPAPVLEFREANTDFQVDRAVKRALGALNFVEKHGYVGDVDRFMSQYSTLDLDTIKEARKLVKRSPREPYIFRYVIGNNRIKGNPDYSYELSEYAKDKNVLLGFLPEENHGLKAVVLPGESIVFHRRPHHRFSVMGKYNPALINHSIGQAIEHKYLEYKFWEEFKKGAMPKTTLLKDLATSQDEPAKVIKALNDKYPNGWILKGVFDLATEKHLVTNDLDVEGEITRYRNSNFDTYYRELRENFRGEDIEDIIVEVKEHPNYFGWKLNQFFSRPHEVIAQQKVKIKTEYRVEVIAGQVLGEGTTVDRYSYMNDQQKKAGTQSNGSVETIRRVEAFTQDIVDSLPEEFRGMTFAFDIAVLEDGSLTMIESNPGGNSGFLAQSEESIHALNRKLSTIPEQVNEGKLHLGLTPKSQIDWITQKISEWGLELNEIPDMKFYPTFIADKDFRAVDLSRRWLKNRTYRATSKENCYQLMKGLIVR